MNPEANDEKEQLRPLSYNKKRGPAIKTNKKDRLIDLDMIERYCKQCVTWAEAKPVVDMLYGIYLYGLSPDVFAAINRIKQYFNDKMYGCKTVIKKMRIAHADVAVGVAEKGSNVFHEKNTYKSWKKVRRQNC